MGGSLSRACATMQTSNTDDNLSAMFHGSYVYPSTKPGVALAAIAASESKGSRTDGFCCFVSDVQS